MEKTDQEKEILGIAFDFKNPETITFQSFKKHFLLIFAEYAEKKQVGAIPTKVVWNLAFDKPILDFVDLAKVASYKEGVKKLNFLIAFENLQELNIYSDLKNSDRQMDIIKNKTIFDYYFKHVRTDGFKNGTELTQHSIEIKIDKDNENTQKLEQIIINGS